MATCDETPQPEPSADRPIIVAIDGPSGVGKSTAARRVAALLEIPYLDTGAMYRCIALWAIRRGLADAGTAEQVSGLLSEVPLELLAEGGKALIRLDGEDVDVELRTPQVSEVTSRLAAFDVVRDWMVSMQRSFGDAHGGVVEGRDIGTVVFPHTRFKFFLDAAVEVRAQRRYQELKDRFPELTLEKVTQDMSERDRRDSQRATSPLVRTSEHILVDTGSADAETIANRIVSFIQLHSECGE